MRRSSANSTLNIGVLSAGGFANAAAQDSFCASTTCVFTVIYDQSANGNNLTPAPAGASVNTPDSPANATAAPTTLSGHEAYGVYISPGIGYRDDATKGIATGDNPESEYDVVDGTHYDNGCCFDYGNAETANSNDGNGTMEAVYFGNAQAGGLTTDYSGPRPANYNPMRKEGAILLGIGGDNSNFAAGTFYEGVMTTGYASASTEAAVQANIVAAGYGSSGGGGSGGGGSGGGGSGGSTGALHAVGASKCLDDPYSTTTAGTQQQIWDCNGGANQTWTRTSSGQLTLTVGGSTFCLDANGQGTSPGTKVIIWPCIGAGNQQWTLG